MDLFHKQNSNLNAIFTLSKHSYAQAIFNTDCNKWSDIRCHGEQFMVSREIIKNIPLAITFLSFKRY